MRVLHIGDPRDVERVSGLVASYAERPDQPSLSYSSTAAITGRSKSSTSKPFVQQLILLTQRAWWQYARQPVHIIARVAENRPNHSHPTTTTNLIHTTIRQSAYSSVRSAAALLWCAVFLTLFIGCLFFQVGHDQRSLYARIAFIFFLVCMASLVTLVFAVLTCTPHTLIHCARAVMSDDAASRSFYGWTGFGCVS